jgi:hypothetical protein
MNVKEYRIDFWTFESEKRGNKLMLLPTMCKPTNCTFIKLLYISFVVSTYTFRSLVWPSLGCSVV